jgi:hypothetical protein
VIGIIFLVLRVLTALTLYGFIAWAIYSLWFDAQRKVLPGINITPAVMFQFTDRRGNQVVYLTRMVIVIGRDKSCDCRILDESISSNHARLTFKQKQWWLEDLASTNGTFINQERITLPVVIDLDDRIRLGSVDLVIQVAV